MSETQHRLGTHLNAYVTKAATQTNSTVSQIEGKEGVINSTMENAKDFPKKLQKYSKSDLEMETQLTQMKSGLASKNASASANIASAGDQIMADSREKAAQMSTGAETEAKHFGLASGGILESMRDYVGKIEEEERKNDLQFESATTDALKRVEKWSAYV